MPQENLQTNIPNEVELKKPKTWLWVLMAVVITFIVTAIGVWLPMEARNAQFIKQGDEMVLLKRENNLLQKKLNDLKDGEIYEDESKNDNKFNYPQFLLKYPLDEFCHIGDFVYMDSPLCELYLVYTDSDYSETIKLDYYNTYWSGYYNGGEMINLQIDLKSDNEYILPEEYGTKFSQYKESMFADIYIDKLDQLVSEKEIKRIYGPHKYGVSLD